ncbi:MAG: DUF4845 domain-containing protein [Gammaproteobacteria bacterium]|nr:DUF4845 domain-containing protein [Gammaproteobacteria bacterium]
MMNLPAKQKGASASATIIFLALLAYGVYLGIQYVPQAIESQAIDSIFATVNKDHRMDPIQSVDEAKSKVAKMLQVNEMNDMAKNVKVRQIAGTITIKVMYERELDLGFKTKPMLYEKTLVLK